MIEVAERSPHAAEGPKESQVGQHGDSKRLPSESAPVRTQWLREGLEGI